jgi:FkbM family methyltransferase
MKLLRGIIYWLLTAGPVGVLSGWFFRHRCFDRAGPVVLPSDAKANIAGAIIFGVYEYPERKLIQRWLPVDLDCIELGCSIGVISRFILRKLEPERRLFAVEASERLLGLATQNVAAAGLLDRFTSTLGAVHYEGHYVTFVDHGEHIRGKVARHSSADGIPTRCVTLAGIVKTNSIEDYSLVMDIEGSEFDVIANDSAYLRNCRAVIAEIHGDQAKLDSFVQGLTKNGFVPVEKKHSVMAFIRSFDGKVLIS